ncbi:MAG TPA: polysaccharide deacetylase family protein [Acidobacteriaceae bacterium]|nr:polysaccharide deacetylase family protein [Acidobacteriaceae bacterium]
MLAILAASTAACGLAAGGYAYAALSPQSQIFGRTVVAGRDPVEFALTYDDGPNRAWTPQLLDLLARHHIRATFFLIGRFVREQPELARAIHTAGHRIGNHTVSHPWLTLESPHRVREELAGCNAAIEDAIGERVRFFRPPHGARRPDVLRAAREMGLTPVQWNAMGYDWRPIAATEIVANLERGIARNRRRGRGSNLLLHDGGHLAMGADRSQSVEATRLLLERHPPGSIRYLTVDAWV